MEGDNTHMEKGKAKGSGTNMEHMKKGKAKGSGTNISEKGKAKGSGTNISDKGKGDRILVFISVSCFLHLLDVRIVIWFCWSPSLQLSINIWICIL